MTTRTDLVADRLRLRIRASEGTTWHVPWDGLTESVREHWRGIFRDTVADLHHVTHCGDVWEPGNVTPSTDHTSRASHGAHIDRERSDS